MVLAHCWVEGILLGFEQGQRIAKRIQADRTIVPRYHKPLPLRIVHGLLNLFVRLRRTTQKCSRSENKDDPS